MGGGGWSVGGPAVSPGEAGAAVEVGSGVVGVLGVGGRNPSAVRISGVRFNAQGVELVDQGRWVGRKRRRCSTMRRRPHFPVSRRQVSTCSRSLELASPDEASENSKEVRTYSVVSIRSAKLRETRGVAQAGIIGDREVGGRLGLYRLNKRYDIRNN